jgi:hypothetical protein
MAICLLACFSIYSIYRSNNTVINELIMDIVSRSAYMSIKQKIASSMPLNNFIIYNLPEGLWVYCATLVSKDYYLKFRRLNIRLVFLPLLYAVMLEFLQLLHITNGQFDGVDISTSILFWILACKSFKSQYQEENIANNTSLTPILCLSIYCIVYLSHVNTN